MKEYIVYVHVCLITAVWLCKILHIDFTNGLFVFNHVHQARMYVILKLNILNNFIIDADNKDCTIYYVKKFRNHCSG